MNRYFEFDLKYGANALVQVKAQNPDDLAKPSTINLASLQQHPKPHNHQALSHILISNPRFLGDRRPTDRTNRLQPVASSEIDAPVKLFVQLI